MLKESDAIIENRHNPGRSHVNAVVDDVHHLYSTHGEEVLQRLVLVLLTRVLKFKIFSGLNVVFSLVPDVRSAKKYVQGSET